ncbi:MAG: hypothetical protein C4530_10160 [Desulfobacteraceae bacterium]|nr:MAG: hypothetical protein C4530_10160 [Desulfobacteraceae bacterium]
MEHVERDSFWFDLKILVQTVWMLTLGRFRPIAVHPEVVNLKEGLTQRRKDAKKRMADEG